VHSVPVSFGIDGNCLDAKFPAGALDTDGNLATIGD
jgi:hypothetical protein